MTDTSRPRSPIFDYAASVDPAMSAFGWRFITLSYLAVLLPLVGIALPRDTDTRWGIVAGVLVVAVGTLALNAAYLRRMFDTAGWVEPPGAVVLGQAVLVTASTGALNYALSGRGGFYRPIIVVPTILVAVIGNRPMFAVSAVVALATMVLSSWAQGTDASHLAAFAVSYGTTWAVIILMVRLLATSSLQATAHTQGIADAAAIAASTESLDDGLQRLLPVVGAWAVADRVTAYALTELGPVEVEHWPLGSPACAAPSASLLAEAHADGGAAVEGARAVILTGPTEGVEIAVVVESSARNRFDAVTYRYQLRRMADQIGTLVTRSRHIEHLESLGRTDGLTGLPNRRALEERLDLERAVTRQRQAPLSLVMIDLDDFKAYNDTHGHPAGDDLLLRFGEALRASVRSTDLVARYGGEEFCLLLPGTDAAAACSLTEQLRRSLDGGEPGQRAAFSAGIATWDGTETNHDLLKRADRALYTAKADGKGRSVVA